jgi:hypothetical protein
MTREALDMSRPNVASTYDALLGGCDTYAADRAQADELTRIYPGLREVAPEAREFLARTVTWAGRQGITQFTDLGCGIPVAAECRRAHDLRHIRPDADTHAIARAVN